MLDAVILDWDGTLANTKFAVVTAFQTVLREMGCSVTDEFVERRIGIGTRRTLVEALETKNSPFTEEEIEELIKRKTKVQLKLTHTVSLFEGAVSLLESLESKAKVALASMSNRKIIDKLLNEKGIREYFQVVVTADEVIQPKPNPEAFLKCAIDLKCHPDKCVVVEDSIFGVKAARQAGMKCIAIPTGAYSREELEYEYPDLIVNSMEENETILDFILKQH